MTEGTGGEAGEVPLAIDLLRGELYRLLDELARARPCAQGPLLAELERALRRFRVALARRG